MIRRARSRFRRWRRGRRREKAARKRHDVPLREFVYLDEVSVFSLIASRLGPVAMEFTASESSSLRSEVGGSAGASAGLVGTEISSSIASEMTSGSQVMRKATVESTFRELLTYERDTLALSPPGPGVMPPAVASSSELCELVGSPVLDGWLVDPSRLKRGELLEVEVELEADDIFRIRTIMSTLLDLVEENPELIGTQERGDLAMATTANRVLEKLLAGLVPLRGRSTNYQHITLADKDWLIHQQLLDTLADRARLPSRELNVVGVAEVALFWKDLRRVLFSGSRYLVMCRLARDGVQLSWTPVKLADLFADVLPELGDLGKMSRGLLAHMAQARDQEPNAATVETAEQAMRHALIYYAEAVAAAHEASCDEQDLASHGLLSADQVAAHGSVAERRTAFGAVTRHLEKEHGAELDSAELADARDEALLRAGFDEVGALAEGAAGTVVAVSEGREQRFLDAEVVAIYW
jgi:hypothetical protein